MKFHQGLFKILRKQNVTDTLSFVRSDGRENSIPSHKHSLRGGIKIFKAELWFLCMTHHLIVLYNCMKFLLNNFNGCQLTERTRNSIANDQREITKKNIQSRVMVLVHDMSSQCALQLYEVSLKYL